MKKLIVPYLIQDKPIYYAIPSLVRHPKSDLSLPAWLEVQSLTLNIITFKFNLGSQVWLKISRSILESDLSSKIKLEVWTCDYAYLPWNPDKAVFQMVEKRLGFKWSGFWMGSESLTIWNPNTCGHFFKNYLKSEQKCLDLEWSSFWMVGTITIT